MEWEGLDVAPRRDEASVTAMRSDRVLVNSFDATGKKWLGRGGDADGPSDTLRTHTDPLPTDKEPGFGPIRHGRRLAATPER